MRGEARQSHSSSSNCCLNLQRSDFASPVRRSGINGCLPFLREPLTSSSQKVTRQMAQHKAVDVGQWQPSVKDTSLKPLWKSWFTQLSQHHQRNSSCLPGRTRLGHCSSATTRNVATPTFAVTGGKMVQNGAIRSLSHVRSHSLAGIDQ